VKSELLSIITVDVIVVVLDDEITVLPMSLLIEFVVDVVETDVSFNKVSTSPGAVSATEGDGIGDPGIEVPDNSSNE